jgi:hypothetical protein
MKKDDRRWELLGREVGGGRKVATVEATSSIVDVALDDGIRYHLSVRWTNDELITQLCERNPKQVRRVFVIGNGESLKETNLSLLKNETCIASNRIWKIFDETDWRPAYYIRAEIPTYNERHVSEDLEVIAKYPDIHVYLQAGFRTRSRKYNLKNVEYLMTCNGEEHDWHLPQLCGFGTSLHLGIQLAVEMKPDAIYLVGCDLGNKHFYSKETFNSAELARKAHEIASRCSPVTIFNATVGGELDIYRRVRLEDACNCNR